MLFSGKTYPHPCMNGVCTVIHIPNSAVSTCPTSPHSRKESAMAYQNSTNRFARKSGFAGKAKAQSIVVKTWAFDSVGPRKYAIQIKKAGNGNPCLKIVEGVKQ